MRQAPDEDAAVTERLELRLPVEGRSVTIGRRAAAQFAEEAGCPAEVLWRVRLAVSEALSNVMLHAHRPPGSERGAFCELLAFADRRHLVLQVIDHGGGLSERPDSPGMGVGLQLIERACDHRELLTGDDGGLVVSMTFDRAGS